MRKLKVKTLMIKNITNNNNMKLSLCQKIQISLATNISATGKLYHLRLRVECTLFCNLQSWVRTHAVLVIGLYELLGNPTT
jgi:hypothetical protein